MKNFLKAEIICHQKIYLFINGKGYKQWAQKKHKPGRWNKGLKKCQVWPLHRAN